MLPHDEDARPLEAQIPPDMSATPADVRVRPDEEICWWRPGWEDVARHVGWRWVLLSPAIGLVLLYVGTWYVPLPRGVMWMLEIKLLVFVVAIAFSLAGFVVRRIIRARREPFCIYCGYNLTSLPDNYRCPECGRPYTWALIAEYRRDPQWFIERWRQRHDLPPVQAPFAAGTTQRSKRRRDGTE